MHPIHHTPITACQTLIEGVRPVWSRSSFICWWYSKSNVYSSIFILCYELNIYIYIFFKETLPLSLLLCIYARIRTKITRIQTLWTMRVSMPNSIIRGVESSTISFINFSILGSNNRCFDKLYVGSWPESSVYIAKFT